MKRTFLLLASVAVVVVGTASATPTIPPELAAYINELGPAGNFGPNQYTIGWRFNLSSSYTVYSLGYMDYLDDGFAENHDVGIYSCGNDPCTAGSLLVSGTVTSLDPIYNHFRWMDLASPLELAAGHYVIAGSAGTENYQWTGGTITFDPRVTWLEGRYTASATLAFPDITNPNPPISYFGPNFASPEPGTLYLVGGVALLLAGRFRRRKV